MPEAIHDGAPLTAASELPWPSCEATPKESPFRTTRRPSGRRGPCSSLHEHYAANRRDRSAPRHRRASDNRPARRLGITRGSRLSRRPGRARPEGGRPRNPGCSSRDGSRRDAKPTNGRRSRCRRGRHVRHGASFVSHRYSVRSQYLQRRERLLQCRLRDLCGAWTNLFSGNLQSWYFDTLQRTLRAEHLQYGRSLL